MSWQFISFFGDSTVILPSALISFVILLLSKKTRPFFLSWGLLFGLTGAIVCASKLAFMAWGVGIRSLDFTGFSGHTALSAIFWPIFLWLLISSKKHTLPILAAVAGYLLACLVGYSRLEIHAHSTSEVVAGLFLGSVASAMFFILWRNPNRRQGKLSGKTRFYLAVLPLCLLNTGAKAPTQSILEQIAKQISSEHRVFTRADLLR